MSEPNEKLQAIFEAALVLESDAQRADYLNRACPDPELRREVEALLAAHARPDSIFDEKPARASRPSSEQVGMMIGRYKLLEALGEGGFGAVWLAEQKEPVRRKVALKIIKLGMDTKQVVARFEAERQALALMDHPNIAKVLDGGTTESGRPYFVMELVRGIPITTFCDENNLATRNRLDLFIQVCQAVQHAHQKGVIHRDLKPSNILVTLHDGVPVPKVIDFGIAKAMQQELTEKTIHTLFQQFIGTPAYVSPEQAQMSGLDLDTRSDIYTLGVLLYELLTGQTPFDPKELLAAGLDEMRRTIREVEPVKPSTRLNQARAARLVAATKSEIQSPKSEIEEDLDWIVMKCLEKDRARRYETATGLAADLTRHLNDEPVVARPPSRLYEFQKALRRHKVAFGAAAAVLLVLACGIALSAWQAARAKRAEQEQRRLRREADSAWQNALTESNRAAAAMESKKTLAAWNFREATRLIAEDNAADAAAYLAQSVSLDPANPAALMRLATLLEYRMWMLPTVAKNIEATVNSVEFNPDGTRFVTGLADGTARVWDARTGRSLLEPLKHASNVIRAQFSPNGQRIITTGSGLARVWDAETGQLVAELKEKGGPAVPAMPQQQANQPPLPPLSSGARSVELSPSGKQLVTICEDNAIRLWDTQTGSPLTEPMKHPAAVASAHFSPNGERIVTTSGGAACVWDARTGQPVVEISTRTNLVSADGKRRLSILVGRIVTVVDAQTGQPLTQPMRHEALVTMTLFSPDGKVLVTVSLDRIVRVWDAQTGRQLTEPIKHASDVTSAQFSPDGTRLVTTTGNTARVWDARTAQPLLGPMKHPSNVSSAQFSPDGIWIATTAGDTACVWDTQTGQPVAETLVRTNLFGSDGQRGLSSLLRRILRVVDARTGQGLTQPMAHEAEVTMALFSPDGTRLLTVTQDNAVRVWDAQSGKALTEPIEHAGAVASAQFSPDGRRILIASRESTERVWGVRVWDTQTGQPLREPMKHTNRVDSAQFSPDGTHIVTIGGGTVRLWNVQTGQPITELKPERGPTVPTRPDPGADLPPLPSALSTNDGIETRSKDNQLRVWDAKTGQPVIDLAKESGPVPAPPNPGVNLPPLPPEFGSDGVHSVRFSPDGRRLVTLSRDKTVRVWDAQTGQLLTEPIRHTNAVALAQFTADGQQIETFSRANQVRVWDARTGQLVTEYKKEDGQVVQAFPDSNAHLPPVPPGPVVVSVQFSPDAKRLVTVSRDKAVRVWDAQTGKPLTEPMQHTNLLTTAQFSADAERVETFSTDDQVRVWDAHTGQPLPELAKEGGTVVSPRPSLVATLLPLSTASNSNAVLAAEFSSDGRHLVTVSRSNSVVVWDAQTGRPVSKPLKHTNEVSWVRLRLGEFLVTTFTKDNRYWVWDSKTGERMPSYGWGSREDDQVYERQSREGKRRVIVASGATARVFETERVQPVTEPMLHDADVSIAELSSDGRRAVTVTKDNTLRVWEARTARPRPLMAPFPFERNAVPNRSFNSEPQFSHDGRRVLMPSARKQAYIWDALTGEPLTILAPAGSPDSEWDADLGEPGYPLSPRDLVFWALWSPDDQRILTAAFPYTNHPTEFRIWNVRTGQALTLPVTLTNTLQSVQFSPDGKRLLVTIKTNYYFEGERTVRVLDAETGRPLSQDLVHKSRVVAAQFSSDGQRLLTATTDGTLQVWDASSGEPTGAAVKLGSPINNYGRFIAQFSADGQHLVATTGKDKPTEWADTFRVWDVPTGQPLTEPIKFNPRATVDSLRFSLDAKRIVTTSIGTKGVHVWDAATGLPLTDRLMHAPRRYHSAYNAKFSPDGRRLLIELLEEAGIWELPPSHLPGPAWLLELAEAISGRVLNKNGALGPTATNRLETIDRIRQKLATEPDDDWVVWGRWLLADRATRTISPFSKVSVQTVINRLIQDNTLPSLQEATDLAPGNSAAWAGLAWRLKEQYPTLRNPGALDQAESCARRAIQLDPSNGTAWRTLAAVHSIQSRANEAMAALERVLQLQPTNALTWEVRGEILARSNRLAEALAAFDRQVELQPASTNQAGNARRRALLNRADVLRRLGRWDDTRQAVSVACGIAPRDPQAATNLLDLSAFYNAGLKENWPADLRDHRSERYWRDQSGYTNLPAGVQTLAGTSFDVRGIILLQGEGPCTRRLPNQVAGLPAPGKYRRVHFLHGAVRAEAATEIARYVVHFADGTTEQRSIVLETDVDDWRWRSADEEKDALAPAWLAPSGKERNALARLHKTTWENPKPDLAITSIDFVSTSDDATPFLVAITAE